MKNDKQAAIEALESISQNTLAHARRHGGKELIRRTYEEIEIIRAALQPVDVDLKELEKKYTPSFNNDRVIGWNNCLKYLRENGYRITKE